VTYGAIGLAALLVPLALFAAWFLRPRTIRGGWRRIGIVGAVAGVPRQAALTFGEYSIRLGAALPRGPTRRGSAPAALIDIAALSDRALYARHGLDAGDRTRIDGAWRQVARHLPGLGWRAVRRRRVTP
jgi:hypothetical protein